MAKEGSSSVAFEGYTLTRSPDGSRVGLLSDTNSGEAAFSVPSDAPAKLLLATLYTAAVMRDGQTQTAAVSTNIKLKLL